MKRICIYYRMSIDHSRASDDHPHNIETAETCITLAMIEEIADDILEKQADSKHLGHLGDVRDILRSLARIQGYTEMTFLSAEID